MKWSPFKAPPLPPEIERCRRYALSEACKDQRADITLLTIGAQGFIVTPLRVGRNFWTSKPRWMARRIARLIKEHRNKLLCADDHIDLSVLKVDGGAFLKPAFLHGEASRNEQGQ